MPTTYRTTFPISSMETIIRNIINKENQSIHHNIKLQFREIGPTTSHYPLREPTRMLTAYLPHRTYTRENNTPNDINLYHITFEQDHITITERLNAPKRHNINHNDPNLLNELKTHINRILKNHTLGDPSMPKDHNNTTQFPPRK